MTRDNIYSIIKQREELEFFDISKIDSDSIKIDLIDEKFNIFSTIRWQFDKLITPQGINFENKILEGVFNQILNNKLTKFNSKKSLGFVFKTFLDEFDCSSKEINNRKDLNIYLDKLTQNFVFHKKEVFPKLLDVLFLAKYVGSVSFEDKAEISVGGSFPVHLFKKIAILKWGNQKERYEEYKIGTQVLIKRYAIKKPDKYIPEFQEGFDMLINYLENEPNPFENQTSVI